jgi:hypothetical protein
MVLVVVGKVVQRGMGMTVGMGMGQKLMEKKTVMGRMVIMVNLRIIIITVIII